MMSRRYPLLLLALGALLLVSCVVSLGFGPARLPVDLVGRILAYKLLGSGTPDWNAGQEHIVWLIRVPRMLLGALVGAGLALIGAVLQAVTRNPPQSAGRPASARCHLRGDPRCGDRGVARG